MKIFIKDYLKTLLFFGIIGLLGGYFTGIYLLDSYPEELKRQLINEINAIGGGQISADIFIGIITAIQSAAYGVVLGAVGIWLSKKTGLWKDEIAITKKPLTASVAVAVIGGLSMILLDVLLFGRFSDAIMASYAEKPTIVYILASITYAAVIEEVMLRLFTMSLVAFILCKIFDKKTGMHTDKILIISNVIAALLFAIGHLPATAEILGLTPMIIFRCFLLNGGIGLTFGWLYRKYGLRYAMIAHGGCHIVSKLIWILFI